jgi:hypothetical protein
MARPSSKIVRNERHKLTATFLNTLAAGLIVMVGSGAYYWLHYSRPDRRH